MLLSCYTKKTRIVIPILIEITILLHKQLRIGTSEIRHQANQLIKECLYIKQLNVVTAITNITYKMNYLILKPPTVINYCHFNEYHHTK